MLYGKRKMEMRDRGDRNMKKYIKQVQIKEFTGSCTHISNKAATETSIDSSKLNSTTLKMTDFNSE